MATLGLRLRTLRHFSARQLFSRVSRLFKARRIAKECKRRPFSFDSAVPHLPIDTWPSGLPFNRVHKYIKETNNDGFTVKLLNQEYNLAPGSTWLPSDLAHSRHLWLFHLHYMEYLAEMNNEQFSATVNRWIKENPSGGPGHKYSWHSFVISLRVVEWIRELSKRHSQLSSSDTELWKAHLHYQGQILFKDLETDLGGNHLIKNIKALIWLGSVFSTDESQTWQTEAELLLNKELDQQIFSDGMHFERSPFYHQQVLIDFLEVYPHINSRTLQTRLQAIIGSMAQALNDMMCSDGKVWSLSDGAMETPYESSQVVKEAERVSCRPVKIRMEIDLKDAGYIGMSTSELEWILDCGKICPIGLPAHGHGDALAIVAAFRGQRLFVDVGVHSYEDGLRRSRSRLSQDHNTIAVKDHNQAEFWGSFRVGAEAKAEQVKGDFEKGLFVARVSNLVGPDKELIIERQVTVDENQFSILDSIQSGRPREMESSFLVHQAWEISQESENELVLSQGDDVVRFSSNSEWKVETSTWYPDYGREEPCSRISTTSNGAAPLAMMLSW